MALRPLNPTTLITIKIKKKKKRKKCRRERKGRKKKIKEKKKINCMSVKSAKMIAINCNTWITIGRNSAPFGWQSKQKLKKEGCCFYLRKKWPKVLYYLAFQGLCLHPFTFPVILYILDMDIHVCLCKFMHVVPKIGVKMKLFST